MGGGGRSTRGERRCRRCIGAVRRLAAVDGRGGQGGDVGAERRDLERRGGGGLELPLEREVALTRWGPAPASASRRAIECRVPRASVRLGQRDGPIADRARLRGDAGSVRPTRWSSARPCRRAGRRTRPSARRPSRRPARARPPRGGRGVRRTKVEVVVRGQVVESTAVDRGLPRLGAHAALPRRIGRLRAALSRSRRRHDRGVLSAHGGGRRRDRPEAKAAAARGRARRHGRRGRGAGARRREAVRGDAGRRDVRRLPVRLGELGARRRHRGRSPRAAPDRCGQWRRGSSPRAERRPLARCHRLRLPGRDAGGVHPGGGPDHRARGRVLPDAREPCGVLRAHRRRGGREPPRCCGGRRRRHDHDRRATRCFAANGFARERSSWRREPTS